MWILIESHTMSAVIKASVGRGGGVLENDSTSLPCKSFFNDKGIMFCVYLGVF